jgi:hypothetical protein
MDAMQAQRQLRRPRAMRHFSVIAKKKNQTKNKLAGHR